MVSFVMAIILLIRVKQCGLFSTIRQTKTVRTVVIKKNTDR